MLLLQAPRLRADLHHRDRARVVDVDGRLGELVAGRGEAGPVVGRKLAGAKALGLDLCLAAHETLRHLRLRHLEREEGDWDSLADAEVRGHAEAECRLPHARPCGDDDEVPLLEAGRDAVDVAEAGRNPGDVGARFVERGDPLEALLQELLDVAELAARPLLGEVEDDLLGLVDELRRLAGPVPAELGDLAAGPNEPTERRRLADDLRVMVGVCGRGSERGQLVDAEFPADVLELAPLVELVRERDCVDGLTLRVEAECRAVDLRVAFAVELTAVAREDLAHRGDRPGREHHRAENGLLGIEVLWRDERVVEHHSWISVRRHRTRPYWTRGVSWFHRPGMPFCRHNEHMFASEPDDIPRTGRGLPTEIFAPSGKFVQLFRRCGKRVWRA